MDTSPPSIHVYDFNSNYGPHRPPSRSPTHASKHFATSPGPMSIPNSRIEAPPPLPPPRFVTEIAAGSDLGWQWGNRGYNGSFRKSGFGSVNAGSSLHGNNKVKEEARDYERPGALRRDSSSLTIKSAMLPDTEMKYDMFRNQDEGYHSLSGSSLTNQLLHGGEALAQRNHTLAQRDIESSSQAYDKQLLSKIGMTGKPKTPPRTSTMGSVDAPPSAKTGFYQGGKYPHQLKSLSVSEGMSPLSDSPYRTDSSLSSKWENSPRSSVASPGRATATESPRSFMDYRSPTLDGSVPSSAIDPERFAHVRGGNRRTGSGSFSIVNFEEASSAASLASLASLASRANRESYDQAIFAEPDSDFPMHEETGRMRQLHIDDRPPPSASANTSASASASNTDPYFPDQRPGGGGMKRRASSPPREASRDDKAALHSLGTGSEVRRTSGHLSAHANRVSPFYPNHSSISSTSSGGLRNGSYASSGALSFGGSSITSASSHERLSPSGVSPSADQHDGRDSPYGTPASLNPSPRSSLSRPHQRTSSVETKSSAAAIARNMSSDNVGQLRNNNASDLQGVYMCECCPKKPKKFNNPQDKQNHEMEKQYSCQYCHNRFKNKNEAERHQNSLHLRRHSWSCATLQGNIHAAFHPSTAIPTSTNNSSNSQPPNLPTRPAASDICGYCGDEFPNYPSPDWAARRSHVINVHKFGECNQSKKFFRADHFRQHLKHSHAGTSGKWTNMLETSCMKEEPQEPSFAPSPVGGAPVANMGMPIGSRAGGLSAGGFGGISGLKDERIDEMRDEA